MNPAATRAVVPRRRCFMCFFTLLPSADTLDNVDHPSTVPGSHTNLNPAGELPPYARPTVPLLRRDGPVQVKSYGIMVNGQAPSRQIRGFLTILWRNCHNRL